MEKKIMYTETAPDKKFLWLHHKDGDLILEGFGNKGWESVGKDSPINTEELIAEVTKAIKPQKPKAIKVTLPKLTEDCSKRELISAVDKLIGVLTKAGIIAL